LGCVFSGGRFLRGFLRGLFRHARTRGGPAPSFAFPNPAKPNTTKKKEREMSAKRPRPDDYGERYPINIRRVTDEHVARCEAAGNTDRRKSRVFTLVQDMNYLVSKKTKFDDRGRKIAVPKNPHRRRMTFFSGGDLQFPFEGWSKIHLARTQDIELGNALYDNDIAYSDEGIRLFIELDYRSKEEEPKIDDILSHAAVCQRVVKTYFEDNRGADFSYWCMLCTPRPKYVKDEVKPVIAMGCHIVFPNITITCAQGMQLCHSASVHVEAVYGSSVVDEGVYKADHAALRPAFCCKMDDCHRCGNDSDISVGCVTCGSRGRITNGSVYKPSFLFDSDGNDVHRALDARGFESMVSEQLHKIVSDTSIVAPSREFTKGFRRPDAEPEFVPKKLRSTHVDDVDKPFMSRIERSGMSRRRRPQTRLESERALRCVKTCISSYHPEYAKDGMVVTCVNVDDVGAFVEIKGVASHFCRVVQADGVHHSSNRIFFRIDRKKRHIAQHCYKNECATAMRSDKEIRARLCKTVSHQLISEVFGGAAPKAPEANRHDGMLDFIHKS
jgi:hypothetical protein